MGTVAPAMNQLSFRIIGRRGRKVRSDARLQMPRTGRASLIKPTCFRPILGLVIEAGTVLMAMPWRGRRKGSCRPPSSSRPTGCPQPRSCKEHRSMWRRHRVLDSSSATMLRSIQCDHSQGVPIGRSRRQRSGSALALQHPRFEANSSALSQTAVCSLLHQPSIPPEINWSASIVDTHCRSSSADITDR